MRALKLLLSGVGVSSIIISAIMYVSASRADTTGIDPVIKDVIAPDEFIMDTFVEMDKKEINEAIECMIENLYHEARGDGYAGMYAVAMVVMNRVADHRYPDDICAVIYQGPVYESWKTRGKPVKDESERVYYPVKHRCQFSWYCDGLPDDMNEIDSFYTALEIAEMVVYNSMSGHNSGLYIVDITEGATHYHATSVAPKWRFDRGMAKTARIGDHLFYRWN